MQLRPYQQAAIDAVYQHLAERDDNPCIVIPTGGGKTPCIATICRDAVQRWGGRVLVLAHVKELLQQSADRIRDFMGGLGVGIYSAGLRKRDTDTPVVVAGIQSVYRKPYDLGRFDIILVDEVHLIPPDGEGMYLTFLQAARTINPNVRVIGLTATPFRLKDGAICAPENILNHVCYEVGVKELIRDGYLSPLISRAGTAKADTSGLHVRGGEFIADEVEALMDAEELVAGACNEITTLTKTRVATLIFCAGVAHAQHVAKVLREQHGIAIEVVTGDTPTAERDRIIAAFKAGELRYLANVNVLTTGFDAPHVDCVVLLRPTLSPGLYYQMCLDMETEVLTPSGWRRCHEVVSGDAVAAFDLKTEQIQFVKSTDKVHRVLRPEESMVGVLAPHLDLRVTDRHDLVVKSRSRSTRLWRKQEAKAAAERKESFLVPVAAGSCAIEDVSGITDDELRFVGWFMGDGCINRANGSITISQSEAKFADEVRRLLMACGFGWREYPMKKVIHGTDYRTVINFVIPMGEPRGDQIGRSGWARLAPWLDKDVPSCFDLLSRRQFAIFIAGFHRANGRCRDIKTLTIACGCRQRLADRIQALAVIRGFRCSISNRDPHPSDWNPHPQRQWIVRLRPHAVAMVGGTREECNPLGATRNRLQSVPFRRNEWVWCMTTPLGTLVTRRNGKVTIVGNCGRGFRLAEGKEDCLVLDYGGNVLRHGPVDQLTLATQDRPSGDGEAPAKECPECQAVIAAAFATCPHCGHEFPPPDRQKHEAKATSAGVLSGQFTDTDYRVRSIYYAVHTKRGADEHTPKTLRVEYEIGWGQWQKEWICVEHQGFARRKAEAWWAERSQEPCPTSAEEAVDIATRGGLSEPSQITVRNTAGEEFDRIVAYELSALPAMREPGADEDEPVPMGAWADNNDDDIPF